MLSACEGDVTTVAFVARATPRRGLARIAVNEPRFPTRTYPYRRQANEAGLDAAAPLPPGKIYMFRIGLDPEPRLATTLQLSALNDPMATLVLRRGKLPLTLRDLLSAIGEHDENPIGLPETQTFVVAEGGLIAPAPAGFSVNARIVAARGRRHAWPTFFVSTTAPFDSRDVFLQALAWDEAAGAFQFYERRVGSWIWAGSSWDALAEPTRGRGPFDSHVNGGMVMKELKAPWLHWHSMAQTLPDTLFPEPARSDALFVGRTGAQVLERIVKSGVDRWTAGRLDRVLDGPVVQPAHLLRHVLTTTSVNIVSATQESDGPGAERISVPLTFILNADVLFNVVGLEIGPELVVTRARYSAAIAAIGQMLRDATQTPPFQRVGDVFFAWSVPEPSYEDFSVVSALVQREVLSAHFVGALLMADCCNPVLSEERASLMEYVPDGPVDAGAIEPLMRERIGAAADAGNSLAAGVSADLALAEDEWRDAFGRRVMSLSDAVQRQLDTDAGLQALLHLADFRRRQFRKRPLGEFDLSLPWLPESELGRWRLRPDGTPEEM
jgi:hypothetical protein